MTRAVSEAQSKRDGVIWIEKMVTKDVVYQLYTHAAVFVCPSIYEPFGIINLEAMACETAVVAAAVGGIKEVVVEGETGFLVPLEQMQTTPFEPVNPDKFSRDMAEKINRLMADEPLRKKFGEAGRKRAVEKFSWANIAAETKKMYESLV
jgi:glycosyltransferase involved in cell wall biosynthesis